MCCVLDNILPFFHTQFEAHWSVFPETLSKEQSDGWYLQSQWSCRKPPSHLTKTTYSISANTHSPIFTNPFIRPIHHSVWAMETTSDRGWSTYRTTTGLPKRRPVPTHTPPSFVAVPPRCRDPPCLPKFRDFSLSQNPSPPSSPTNNGNYHPRPLPWVNLILGILWPDVTTS